MNSQYINKLIEEEIIFGDKISSIYHYPDNITHLLYLIIPAFIIKYGSDNKHLVEECFRNVPIKIDDKHNQVYQAYYFSIPKYVNDSIVTTKGIVLNNYNNISLIQLIDNLVHEYNHAINSMNNEINIKDTVMVRTGISFNHYDKSGLAFIKKSDEIILEEVINTKQTEAIVDIIKDFSNYDISNSDVVNTLYSIYHTVGDGYHSKSYYLESIVCKKLLENKTFISTFEILRFDGYVEDLHHFFDNITGNDGSLLELCKLLRKTIKLQEDLSKIKFLNNIKINRIKKLTDKALKIVELFNSNTIYK